MDVTVVATTWLPPGSEVARRDALLRAAESWWRNLRNDDGNLFLHIQDDGSSDWWIIDLLARVGNIWPINRVTHSTQHRQGVGASLNAGLRVAFEHSPIVLHAVDDWELLAPLDLTPWVNFLSDPTHENDVGMVRFFPHPDLTGEIKHIPPHGWAVRLAHHHFAFAFRPALFHQRMFDYYGWFEEGVSSFDTEIAFNDKVCAYRRDVGHDYYFGGGPRIWLALPEQWRPIETGSLAAMVPS